jgi:hypothetical protein
MFVHILFVCYGANIHQVECFAAVAVGIHALVAYSAAAAGALGPMDNGSPFAPFDEDESDDEMVVRRPKVMVSPFILPTFY